MRMSIAIGHNNVIRKNDVDVIVFSWLSKGICQVVDFLEITLVLSAGGFEFIGDIKLGPTSIGGLTIFVVYLAGRFLSFSANRIADLFSSDASLLSKMDNA